MGKLSILQELETMINSGEIMLEEGKEEGIVQLRKIKEIVEQQLEVEIWKDITAYNTAYYAPEYPDWQHFLEWCNGDEDYSYVLRFNYTNQVLEEMWQNSHISEEMTEKQIKDDIVLQIGQLKMLAILEKMGGKPCNLQKMESIVRGIRARIAGLYNILYEE